MRGPADRTPVIGYGAQAAGGRASGWRLAVLLLPCVTACQPAGDPGADTIGATRSAASEPTAIRRSSAAEASGQSPSPAESQQGVEPIAPGAVGAIVTCVVCHGAQGEGKPALNVPRIGGMAEWYLERQLRHFFQGVRAGSEEDVYGTQMRAIALTFEGEKTIEGLASYFAELDPPAAPETISGDVARGEQLYATCAACHGEDGRGQVELNTPSLVEQYDWYVLRQLENFSAGIRGTHPEDIYGRQMVPIMQTLTGGHQDLVDVVAYINTL